MTLLIIGIVLWWVAHLTKRVAPGFRANLQERFGNGSRGLFAILIVLSVVLMVFGYRAAPVDNLYILPGWAVHANNTLMVLAVILMGMGSSRGRARSWLRHPMLTGVIVWAAAHLLVNGDVASIVLFGSMAGWAVVSMLAINAAEGPWVRPEPGPASGDIKLLVISAVVFVVIVTIHAFVGPSPFMR